MQKERYLIKGNGADVQALKRAFNIGADSIRKFGDLVIVVPTIRDFKSTILTTFLNQISPDLSKVLFKDRVFNFADGKKIYLCAATTLKDFKRSPGYLLLWGSHYLLYEVEGIASCQRIVELSWMDTDFTQWEKEFSPIVI